MMEQTTEQLSSQEVTGVFEYWDAGGNDIYVYSEVWDIARRLKKEQGRCATYMRNGYLFAWQFTIRKQRLRWLENRFGKIAEAQS